MAKLVRNLALLAAAAETARRYAQKNPEKASKLVDQAAEFVDKQTKGRYRSHIDTAARTAKGAAGIPHTDQGSAPAAYDAPRPVPAPAPASPQPSPAQPNGQTWTDPTSAVPQAPQAPQNPQA